jgi:hypothetical protein
MKIKLLLSQLKSVLKSEPIKFPLTYKGEDFTDKELNDLIDVLQIAVLKKD